MAAENDRELIEPRTDERLETGRLESYLRRVLPVGDAPLVYRQFGGGHANLTYMICFGDVEYVLRRPPLGLVAATAHDMAREHRVLAALSRVYQLAPASLVLCEDESVIGAPFHIMERRHGFVIRDDLPAALAGDPAFNRRLCETLITTLAELHMVNPETAGLGDIGRPAGFAERQLAGWTRRWQAAKDCDNATVDRVVAWLSRGVPVPQGAKLIHNDFKLDNILVDLADPAKAVAVLDWDMCTRGDPLIDLGYLLNFWAEADDPDEWQSGSAMPTWYPGALRRDEAARLYARLTGLDTSELSWYVVFGAFKLLVILQQIYIRYLRGQTRDRRFAGFGERIKNLADKAATLTESG